MYCSSHKKVYAFVYVLTNGLLFEFQISNAYICTCMTIIATDLFAFSANLVKNLNA